MRSEPGPPRRTVLPSDPHHRSDPRSSSADEVQNQDDNGDHDEDVDERTEVEGQEAEQPQHEQDRSNGEQHDDLRYRGLACRNVIPAWRAR